MEDLRKEQEAHYLAEEAEEGSYYQEVISKLPSYHDGNYPMDRFYKKNWWN